MSPLASLDAGRRVGWGGAFTARRTMSLVISQPLETMLFPQNLTPLSLSHLMVLASDQRRSDCCPHCGNQASTPARRTEGPTLLGKRCPETSSQS